MSRHFSSKIFHEPCPGDSRTRDLFPLPTLDGPGPVQGNVCRAVRRRIHKCNYDIQRVNMAITSLNSLFFGGGKRFKSWSTGDMANLPNCQRDSLRSIVQSIRAFGAPPAGASSSGALQALRTVSNGYSEPEIGVGAVCNMALNQLSLPSGAVAGVDLSSALEEPLRSIVCDFENWMLVDGDTWASVADEAMGIRTYNDPSLHHKKDYIRFLRHLHKCGILGLVSNCRGRVGAFTVTKKPKVVNGELVKRQRLILDCRAVNYMFKEPPHTRLGSLAALTELELPTNERLFVAGSDIQDCFYAARLPLGLEECFCLHQDISLDEAVDIFGEDFHRYSHLERFIPCVTVLPMGFSWSFYIIQQLHEQASIRALNLDPQDLIKDGNPAPSLGKGSVLAMPYCDNVHCLSTSREAADRGKDLIAEELRRMGFSLHEDEDASTYFRTLGGVIDGEVGSVAPTREKAWNCILAFEYLLSHKVSCKLVQQLIGHSIVVFVLNRSGMSIFRRLYDFVQSDCKPRFLTPGELEEVRNFIGLMPLMYGNIRLQWSDTVTCTDASPFGYGICERSADLQQVRNIGRWQERWRFKHLDPENWKPRERVQGRDVLSDIRTARCFPVPTCIDDLYELDGDFPEVPTDFMEPKQWHTVLMGRWKNTSEHITLKEGRTIVLAARRLSRAGKSRGKRHLILVDSLALAMSSCKGRATNYGMLRIMQQLGALCLGGGFSIRLRWIISELNVADGPSRGQIKAGPFEYGPSETSQGSIFKGAAESCGEEETSCLKQGSESSITHCHREEAEEDDKSGGGESRAEEKQDSPNLSQSEHQQERGREFGSEQSHDTPREVLSVCQHRESVWGLLPEVSEFLPGSRIRSSTKSKHRCVPFRLHGCDVPRWEAGQRGGEDSCQYRVPSFNFERKTGSVAQSFAGLAKGKTSRKQIAATKAGCIWNEHASTSSGKTTSSPQTHLGFRHLHEGRRKSGFGEKELGHSSQIGWTPIQVVCSSDPRLRRRRAGQGGHLRQFGAAQHPRTNVAGSSAAQPREDSQLKRIEDLPLSVRRVQRGPRCGSQGSWIDRDSSLPMSSRWGFRRFEFKSKRFSKCEEQGKVANGPVGSSVWEDWQDPATSQPSLKKQDGVLSMVTPELGESFQRSHSSSSQLKWVDQDVFSLGNKPHKFGLEIFAGTARVASAVCSLGIPMFPIDICIFPNHDVLQKNVEWKIVDWIQKGRICFIWLGMPCTTFSRARKLDGLGPGPLRDSDNLHGLANLSYNDRRKLLLGNQLFYFTIRIMQICCKYKIPYALENPASSMVWEMPALLHFRRMYNPGFLTLDFCQYGELWRKPTSILYQFIDFSSLAKQCTPSKGRCCRTNRPHIRLTGVDHDGVFLTLRAQPYPIALATLVSKLVSIALQG